MEVHTIGIVSFRLRLNELKNGGTEMIPKETWIRRAGPGYRQLDLG